MASEENGRYEGREGSEIGEIGNRVRYIQRRVSEISSQLDDHYHLLREIQEAVTGPEPGQDWTDLYDLGNGNDYD